MNSSCIECNKFAHKIWVSKSKAHLAEYKKRYEASRPAKIKKRLKAAEYRRNRDHYAKASKRWRLAHVAKVIKMLGGECRCCKEHRPTMLEIDHINDDGAQHRKRTRGYKLYTEIWRDPDAKKKFQVLCANCNKSKYRNGGACEHKQKA